MHSIKSVTEALKAARVFRAITQKQLGEQLGISQSRVSKIERGDIDVRVSTLLELARALDLDLMLVPGSLVPLVKSLTPAAAAPGDRTARRPRHRLDGDG